MKALLIVDMVKGFVDKETNDGPCALYLPKAATLFPHINNMIRDEKPDIIFFVNDNHEEDDREFDVWPRHCIIGTEEIGIANGFDLGKPGHIIPKTRFSGFYNTTLDRRLRVIGATELIVAGVATEICIMHTVADARMMDWPVTVFANTVAGLSDDGHDWALEHMEKVLGAKVVR